MAKSMRSKRKQRNRALKRQKLKPKFDARLQAIVATMKEQTDEVMESVSGNTDLSNEIQIVVPTLGQTLEPQTDISMDSTAVPDKLTRKKIPKVDIKNLVKFMSHRKKKEYMKKEKAKRQQAKKGKKKKKAFKW